MKAVGIILIIVSLCGIAWLGLSPFLTSLPDAEPQSTREILATPTIQQAQPTATNQPTATATTWYDLPATQAAIDAARAEAEKAQAEKDLLILQMTKDAADITNRLALDESERESEDLQARIGLAYANATATAQAHNDAVQVQMSVIRIEQKWQDITILVAWVIVGIAITGALVLMLRIWRSVDYRESGDSIEDNEPIQAETYNSGYMEVMQLDENDASILRNAAARIAYHMDGLMSYRSVNEDCPDEAQRILRAEWTDVRAVLIDKKYNLAKERVGGVQVTDTGINVINGLLPR